MAIGKASDFVIYQEEFHASMVETLAQMINAFGAASNNAIRIVPGVLRGNYSKESFFDDISTAVARRDTTSVSAATDIAMTMDENISVKLDRRIGPVAQTLDAFRKLGLTDDSAKSTMSARLGEIVAKRKMADYLNSALISVEAALDGQTALEYDNTGQTNDHLTHLALSKGRAKLGDAYSRIVAWVMHGTPWHDLIGDSLSSTNMIANVGGTVVNEGTPGTLGIPAVVTDDGALINGSGSTATYNVLGLVENAVVVTESEPGSIVAEVVTGLDNLVYRIQGEYSYNVGVKGFKWDTTNGGANPTDATLGTTTNWDAAVADTKNMAGVHILVDPDV